jgi:hypothetical protein
MYSQSEEKQADCLSKNATNTVYSLRIFVSFGFARAELNSSCKWSVRLRNCTDLHRLKRYKAAGVDLLIHLKYNKYIASQIGG